MILFDKILEMAKTKKVKVFFDMDGTCAEFKSGEKNDILTNKKGLFLDKRPIKTVLKVMERLSKIPNVEVCILSNCHYQEQKEEKIEWLRKFAPFIIPENIFIIVLSNENYTSDNKHFLKGNKIKKILSSDETAFLIEDDHRVIKATQSLGIDAEHVSMLIE